MTFQKCAGLARHCGDGEARKSDQLGSKISTTSNLHLDYSQHRDGLNLDASR
jgi:hypothetical protein